MKTILRLFRRTPNVKFWHLIVATVLFGGLALVSLRANNQHMGELKEAVIQADKEGEGTYEALDRLADYVFQHMNTSTEIELASTYDRHVQREFSGSRTDDVDARVYDDAEEECNRPGVPGTIRAQCLVDYVTEHGSTGGNSQPFEPPPQHPYKYAFVAPLWSTDLAGFSLLLFAASTLWLLGKTTVWLIRHH